MQKHIRSVIHQIQQMTTTITSLKMKSFVHNSMRSSLTEIYEARIAAGTLRADPAQRSILSEMESLRTWLEANATHRSGLLASLFAKSVTPPPSIYLWGDVGRGKSMIMELFTEAVNISSKRRVHFHAFMQSVHHGMFEARKVGTEDPLTPVAEEIINNTRLLAFDEMQITDITDAMVVGRLFDKILTAGVIIVTTSNRSPTDLYKNGLNHALFLPFIELLETRFMVREIVSPTDYRQHRLSGQQVYFYPADQVSTQIEAIWTDLTGGTKDEPLNLPVNGHTVTVPRFINGIGRASFWELCARPLGPGDYLAIAANIRVMILEDIPLLSASNYNEAKRFITLIDALYEAKIQLICSAADIPERLYLEGAGAFEFKRTASRLREMQSASWAT